MFVYKHGQALPFFKCLAPSDLNFLDVRFSVCADKGNRVNGTYAYTSPQMNEMQKKLVSDVIYPPHPVIQLNHIRHSVSTSGGMKIPFWFKRTQRIASRCSSVAAKVNREVH